MLEVVATRRPTSRGDCRDDLRPCPWVNCRHHLWIVRRSAIDGAILETLGDDPTELEHSCSLDVAESVDGVGLTLAELGRRLGRSESRACELVGEAAAAYRRAELCFEHSRDSD